MPPFKEVPGLQATVLNQVSHMLQRLCCDHSIAKKDLKHVIDYFDILLPPQIQASVCEILVNYSSKVIFNEMLNQKCLYICTQLYAEYLWITDSEEMLPALDDLDGKQVKMLKMNMAPGRYEVDEDYNMYGCPKTGALKPLYKFLSTLVSLTSLKCSQMCNNNMLKILSQTCPNLEEIYIDMCTDIDDEGVFYLVGYVPDYSSGHAASWVSLTYEEIRNSVQISAKSGCKKLKSVNLEYTCAGTDSAAILLHLCPNLEELLITPDVNIGDVFTLLHGTNPERYENVSSRYALKVLNNYMELDEDILCLIAKTCPGLCDVTLRCNGVERKDRNFLANLLGLNLESLDVKNCNMSALIWYLEQRGSHIKCLTIQHLSMAPMSLTFTRTHLQKTIKTCPNMEKFTLKLSNNPIQPDLPYSSFGSGVLYFTSLTHLTLEGLSITHDDLSIFISKCETLRELHILILNLEMLEDSVLYDFLSSGCLQNLCYMFLHRPLLTLEGLKRLIKECPQLHTVGPLSSWAIPKKDRDNFVKAIRMNNWDLNIESPEMISMFHV